MNNFNELIKEIDRVRLENSMSLRDLAEIGHLSKATLSTHFTGKSFPRTDKAKDGLKRIAEYLKIDITPIKYGLIELPKQAAIPENKPIVFTAKPKEKPDTFIRLDNGMIANAKTGKTYSVEEFNELFE